MVSTESSEKAIAQHRLLVPRLSLMMFMQFFIWGSWSVTLGLVMTQHNMSLLIGDAFSAGPIASILSPFVLGMLVDRFFASQKVMAVMHLAGGDPVVRAGGADCRKRRAADWPAVWLHALLHADAGADQQHRLSQPGERR
jgi:MFS family permease